MIKKTKSNATEKLLKTIIDGIQEVKGENIVVLDLKSIPHSIADYFVICQGNSNTQVGSIASSIDKETSEKLNDEPSHVEGRQNGLWIILDYSDVLVHVFHKEERTKYNLEDLWGDAQVEKILDRA